MPNSKLVVMKISDLKAAPYNPRTISEHALTGLKASLKRFGMLQPIIWNKRTGNVVGGHQRLKALAANGHTQTDVIEVDLPLKEEKALNVSLNNPAISGEFTDDLQAILNELKIAMPEDFTQLNLDVILAETKVEDIEEDEAPPLPDRPKTKRGQIIRMGDHVLMCGDSCSIVDMDKLMNAASAKADMVFTDPPYGVKFGEANHNPRAKKWAAVHNDELQGSELYDFSSKWVASIVHAAQPAAPLYVWTASMAQAYDILLAMRDGGLHMQSQIIWVKNSLVLGQADYQWRHEICWYGWTKGKKHYWNGGRALTTVWEFAKDPNHAYTHPCQKPIALAAHAMKNSSNPGADVLDLFAGSGSTLMACVQLGRRFIGMEMDPGYCDVIVERWEKFAGSKAKRV